MSEEKVKIDDGGPAFPVTMIRGSGTERETFGMEGITRRQYYAAAALTGILAHSCERWCNHYFASSDPSKCVANAFAIADALIEHERGDKR